MEGQTLIRMLREQLNESSSGSFMNERTSYDFLYTAVQDFNFRTHYLTATQTIPVVATVSSYNLNPDFVGMALMDSYNRPYIKHTYAGSDSFVFNRDYTSIFLENSSSSASVAEGYAVTDASQPANISGSATSSGAAVNGESILTDSTANFSTVYPGDFVHNTTQSTDGVVTATISNTQITCSLFTDGVSGAGWSPGDAYIIVPQPKYKLVLTPTPSDSATVQVPYIQRPSPVYSSFRAYKLPFDYMMPIVQFAAFLYKYRDSEPNYGDAFFKYYDGFARKKAAEMRKAISERNGFRVNFQKVNGRSRQFGRYN